MNSLKTYYFSLLFIFLIYKITNAQAVCAESKSIVPQKNRKEVVLFTESLKDTGNRYFYLPADIQLSEVKGQKEFLFQLYTENGSDGAIMHMLLTWELGQEEEKQIIRFLESRGDSTGALAGNVPVVERSEEAFTIVSDNSLGEILKRSLSSKGKVPTHAGSKMALSFNFKNEDALIMQAAIRNPQKLKGIMFQMEYLYQVKRCGSFPGGIEVKELILKKELGELLARIKS